jgi:N-acetylneuraminic acid mutarotase
MKKLVLLFLLFAFACSKTTTPTSSTPATTNNPPCKPTIIFPLNNSEGQAVSFPILTWKSSDPDVGDTVCYNVFIDVYNPPTIQYGGTFYDTTLMISDLFAYTTTYYWKVVAKDNHGLTTSGDVWSFTTRASPWIEKANIITNRGWLASALYDNKIYSIGGESSDYYNVVECFDISSNTWSTRSSMPTARSGLIAEAVNNRIYAIGGASDPNGYLKIVEEYNPTTDTWSSKTSMPTGRQRAASVVLNGLIYVLGGLNMGMSSGWVLSIVEAYDPVSNTWTSKASMPIARSQFTAQVVNGKIYVMGGESPIVCEYNPTTDSWAYKSDMPFYRENLTSAKYDNKIYVVGGYSSTYPYSKLLQVYDPTTDTWSLKSYMLTDRWGCNAITVLNNIYVIGGVNTWNWLGPTDQYNPSIDI